MTGLPAAVQLMLLALCAFGVLSGLVLSAPAALVIRRMETWAPGSRHLALMILALAPAGVSLALAGAAMLPSLLSLADLRFDHCGAHDDGHAHLCFIHLPHAAASGIGWLIASMPIAWLAAGCIDDVAAVFRSRRLIRNMSTVSGRVGNGRYLELPIDQPLCVTVGLFRPKVVVSTGFLQGTPSAFVSAAVTHEQSHARRRDALWRLIARAATLLYVPPLRRDLLAAIELAAEQACDEDAAGTPEDRLRVAEAILHAERMLASNESAQPIPLGVAFAHDAVARRVESLLSSPRPERSCAYLAAPVLALIATVLLSSEHVHHMTESLLSGLLN